MNNSKTTIIAEVGVNHDGDVSKALDLVDVAAEVCADAVKFQTFIPENPKLATYPNWYSLVATIS